MSVADRVRELVAPICADLGLQIYDIEHTGGRVRVTVDKAGGVDLDELALVTRLISRELDHRDPVPGRYQLEVSSPGLERTLRTPAHYRGAAGQDVSVRLRATAGDERRLTGSIVAADDAAVTLAIPGQGERRIRFEEIERARTVFAWGPGPKPGKAQRPALAAANEEEGVT